MGSQFRSAEMELIQLYIQTEAAHDTVRELGKLGMVQFRDLNPELNAFQRKFVGDVRRANEMERMLRVISESLPEDYKARPDNELVTLTSDLTNEGMVELESSLVQHEKDIVDCTANLAKLEQNFNELIELKYVLAEDESFFVQQDNSDPFLQSPEFSVPSTRGSLNGDESSSLLGDYQFQFGARSRGANETSSGSMLGFLTGVMLSDKIHAFERVLWRSTRGNVYLRHTMLPGMLQDPISGESVCKSVFIVFFQGQTAATKTRKICDSFNASLYPCPAEKRERVELLAAVNQKIEDLGAVLESTHQHKRQLLDAVSPFVDEWKYQVKCEKAIYHTLTLFNYDYGRKCLIAEGWVPKTQVQNVHLALRRGSESSGALVPSILSVCETKQVPPTHFFTNKFTVAFQEMVNSYGTARYGEVNPAVFSYATFPFLFAIMFGDLGHGFLMTLVAVLMIKFEKQLEKGISEIMQMAFEGRYVILLMGFFSMYTGMLYNELFGLPMNWFGSTWDMSGTEPGREINPVAKYRGNQSDFPGWQNFTKTAPNGESIAFNASAWPNRVYPFGMDPTLKVADNSLLFYNSLKMKNSIIVGVVHMSLGIFMHAFNAIHFRKKLDLWFEFVPQVLLFWAIFGYLSYLMVAKWMINWSFYVTKPPMLLVMLLDMFLSPTSPPTDQLVFFGDHQEPLTTNLTGAPAVQHSFQLALLPVILISAIVMLLVKPCVLCYRQKAAKAKGYQVLSDMSLDEEHEEEEEEEDEDVSEIFMHQGIHTIEFVLGAVSNTASYLRLWALSLAHSELSDVFYQQLLIRGFSFVKVVGDSDKVATSSVVISMFVFFITFSMWAGATVGVLMLMESLSSFLHALRLHWVEFQNKFYNGDGQPFEPFAFATWGEEDGAELALEE